MTEEIIKKVESHLAGFEERHKEMERMRDEWEKAKSKLLVVVLCSLAPIVGYGAWIGSVQTKVNHLEDGLAISDSKHGQIETRLGGLEINNSEIRTRLNSIDATLQEIKVAISKL